MGKKKYYVVWEGHQPGIYSSWTDCQLQIKGYPNAKYKSFDSLEKAQAAIAGQYRDHIEKRPQKPSPPRKAGGKSPIIWESMSVDAACSGNPGVMEYQGVRTGTGEQIFYQKFDLGTNNIGEFLAIVHALALTHNQGLDTPIYSDSKIALGWVRQGKCRTKLVRKTSTAYLFQLIERAEQWLKTHSFKNPLLKWNTEEWGEIPADFGRKK